ncbi:MAG TPA: CDP-alcohol phosphatidyltransferase family protein [Flavisolibacter sp.]|nr:CDP-alcohol phosphatidyltransferase family protein [Flavisolibacter sp.]
MKQIPNLFTILNLIFGCMAIVYVLMPGQSILVLEDGGTTDVILPERIWQGALFIFAAAVIDFLDGFLARLMKAQSEMGKQLDSLSDVVSFGVAPGVILYQLLRMAYAQQTNGLDVSAVTLMPAFLFTAAVAWRLAKFNISTNQTSSFKGVPSPAAGLVVASLPLVMMTELSAGSLLLSPYLINEWVLYGLILFLAWLMLSNRTFMAMKFKNFSFAGNSLVYILLALSVAAIVFLKWLAVPVIFILYLLLSAFAKEAPQKVASDTGMRA